MARMSATATYNAILASLGVLCLALLAALSGRSRPLTQATLYLMWEPQTQFLGYYVARDRGFFEDEGLDVRIKHDLGVGESFHEIISQPNVYAINLLSNTIDWLGENESLAAISIISRGCNMGWLSPEPKSRALDRLRRARFYSWWGSQDILLKNFLLDHGYETDPEAASSRMTVGSPDLRSTDWMVLVMTYNELMDYAGAVDTRANFVSYCELGQPIFEDILVGRQARSPDEADVQRRMSRAIWKGWDWARANPDAALDLFMRTRPRRPRELQKRQFEAFAANLVGPDERTTDHPAVARTVARLLEHGLIPHPEHVRPLFESLKRPARLREIGTVL